MMKNHISTKDMLYSMEQQQEQVLNMTISQEEQKEEYYSSQSSLNSNSSSSSSSSSEAGGRSSRVNMTGGIIPSGSLRSRDSASLSIDEDDDDNQRNNERPHPHHPHRKQQKRVSFHSIDIREYSRCLQVHPGTMKGPPIGIDWKYQEVGTFDLEEFETRRIKASHMQQQRWQLLMPANVREALLIESGTTEEEMKAVVEEVRKSQQERQESYESQDLEAWFLLKETCKRRFKRWKTGVSKKREQELLWEAAAGVRLVANVRNETQQRHVSRACRAA
ncbi:unnamed protein product [Cylindrotheca closterium]|uniref:Uncharacterized protein n=1 Tax=Cylindrotheca closterium TaxID=2856 RepID=A0AAD2GDX7_9STRA|nr:unnamed protein product [Cylindrotheca closterium]